MAPYEADAQLAFLNKTIADIVITEDSDLTLFGCDKIIFKLKDSGEGLLYEKRLLNQVFGNQADSFNFDKFRHMCILSGCDYLSSLSGIGLKKSQLFWSKVSNPNLKVVLPKLPVYLKKPTLTVSQDYINGFIQANNTFLYQLVYDPITRKERPLTEYGSGVDAAELDYCGQYSDPNTAYQLALGNVDLHTKQQMTWFDPDHVTSTSNSKYGSKAKHKSMWSKGFTKSSISPFSDNREIHKPREIVVRTNFKFKSPRKSIKSENCEIRGEKRKLETYTQLEVEQIIFSEDEDKEKMPLKKVKSSMRALSNEEREEEELSPSKPYTRILGDNKLDIKNNLSSYFNGKEPTKQEVKELLLIKEKRSLTDPKNAGSWFDSLNKSSTLEGKFIYRTDDKDDKPDKEHGVLADISNSPPFSTPSIGAISPNSKPNLGAISPTSKPNLSALQAFQRDKSRNPFAVKKPIFKDSEKDPEGNPCPVSEPIGREDAPGIDREDLQDNEETSLSEPMQQLLELSKRETEPSVLVRKSCFLTSSSARVGLSRPSGPAKAGLTRPSIFKHGTQTTVIPTGSGVRPSGLHKKGLKGRSIYFLEKLFFLLPPPFQLVYAEPHLENK